MDEKRIGRSLQNIWKQPTYSNVLYLPALKAKDIKAKIFPRYGEFSFIFDPLSAWLMEDFVSINISRHLKLPPAVPLRLELHEFVLYILRSPRLINNWLELCLF
jgi:hypothetical protein